MLYRTDECSLCFNDVLIGGVCITAFILKTMFEPDETPDTDSEELERIYRRTPAGALSVAGIATGLVFALWLVFYLIVFLPRGFLS